MLQRHFPPNEDNHQLVGSQATRANVLKAVANHSWVHFACHGEQHHADPDDSGLAFWDGMLTIRDLAAQPTKHRELAFLSACETGTGSILDLDEAIHLAAAMRFLGYRHVVATMWTIVDQQAPEVADAVYTSIIDSGIPRLDATPGAVHQAVQSLRQLDPTDPLLWAPYIHMGAPRPAARG
jgi:CHAT domain-containing protein